MITLPPDHRAAARLARVQRAGVARLLIAAALVLAYIALAITFRLDKNQGERAHHTANGKQKNMNKKIITLVSVAVVEGLFLLMAMEWAIGLLMPIGKSHDFIFNTIEGVASLLALPVRFYAIFINGHHGSGSSPALILLLASSGLMWGVIVERIIWIFSKLNTPE